GLGLDDKDLVVIASGEQAWLKPWAEYMPAVLVGQSKRFGTSDLIFKPVGWKTPDPRESQSRVRADLSYSSSGDSAIFAGFESPTPKGRSVLLIASSEPQGQALAVKALLAGGHAEDGLRGSLAVGHDGGIPPLAAEDS